jgi:hypothetical protein
MKIVFNVSKDIMKRLGRIRQRQEVRSDVEVIARAISLYEFLTDKVAEDCKVLVVDPQGEAEEVDIK